MYNKRVKKFYLYRKNSGIKEVDDHKIIIMVQLSVAITSESTIYVVTINKDHSTDCSQDSQM